MLKEITLESLWKILKRRILWLIIAAIVFTALAGAFTKVFIAPKYSSNTSFYVETKNATSTSDIATAQRVVLTYIELAKSNTAIKDIIEHAGYTDKISAAQLQGMLTMAPQNETEVFYIKVTSTDKQMAYDIAKAYEERLPIIIDEKMKYNTSVLDEAILAASPDSPNLIKNSMLGGIMGFALLYFVFCLLEYTRTIIYSEIDVKSVFEQPVVGQIVEWNNSTSKRLSRKNAIQLTKKDFTDKLINEKSPFMVTESFKTLRTNLFYTSNNDKCPIYVITSGMINAGKSVIVANLALSYGQLGDKKVLFVDADMRCPVQHKIFSIENKKGLSELLADNQGNKYTEYIQKVNNIDIITSGRIPPNPSELLASKKMKEFLGAVKEDYDIVLIDMPPITEVSDPGIIADMVTGYLYVIRSGYTDARLAKDSIQKLNHMKANVVGFVLNDIKPKYNESYMKYSYKKYAYETGYRNLDDVKQETEKK